MLRRSVQTQLLAAFLVVAGLMTGIGLFNVLQQHRLHERAVTVAQRDLAPMADLRAAQTVVNQVAAMGLLEENLPESGAKEDARKRLGSALDLVVPALKRLQASAPAEFRGDVDKLVKTWSEFAAGYEAPCVGTLTRSGCAYSLASRTSDIFAELAVNLTDDGAKQRKAMTALYESSRDRTIVLLVVVVLLALALGWTVARGIRRPIAGMVVALDRLAAGELDQVVEVRADNEVGQMANALRTALRSLREVVAAVADSVGQLSGSAEVLSAASGRLSTVAEETSAQAETVSTSAGHVLDSVQTAAAGTEEMASTINEIARNAADAARVGAEAVAAAEVTNDSVTRLGESSVEIGKVVKLITAIAEQTHLLALNATIEAARAGEYGRGFAIVASEVKDLAQETAQATKDIAERVQTIQADSQDAVAAISAIHAVINRMNDYQTAIATAVEEQAVTSRGMSRSVTEAANGTTEITNGIGGVADAAQSTSHDIAETARAAAQLAHLSSELRQMVTHFRY